MKKFIVSIAGCLVLAVGSAAGAGSLAVDMVIRLEGAPADGLWEQRDARLAIKVRQVTPGVFDAQVESVGGEARQSLHTRVKVAPGGKALLGGLLNRKIFLETPPVAGAAQAATGADMERMLQAFGMAKPGNAKQAELQAAIQARDAAKVTDLVITQGVNPNIALPDGSRLAHRLVTENSADLRMLEIVLREANPNLGDQHERTITELAIVQGNLPALKIILARRPNLRLKSSAGLPLEMLGVNSTNAAIAALFKTIMTGGKAP
jgi:hypothetical protein